MARRKLQNRNIRKLSRVGGGTSYSLTVPIEMMRFLKWQEKQKVVFSLDKRNKQLKIKDWPVRKTQGKKK